MSKIGDLFVRLGLKKDEFSRGIKQAGSELKGFEKLTRSLSAVAKASWAAIAAAVVKFATDAVKLTQKWGDEWNNTMEGVKAAYGTFVRQLSSGEGFKDLFANMRESYRLAREVAAAMDELFERKNSLSYLEAETERKIAELDLIRRDTSKSEEERKKASEEIIRLETELGNQKKKIAQDEADNYRKLVSNQTKLNSDQIDFLVKNYNENRDIINQSREYLDERAKKEKDIANAEKALSAGQGRAGSNYLVKRYDDAKKALADFDASVDKSVKDVAELTKGYDRGNDELIANLVKADTAVVKVDTDMLRAQARATATLGSLSKSGSGGKSEEELQAEQAEAILRRARDAAKSEVQLLKEKYMYEKALLEKFGLDTVELTREYYEKVAKETGLGVDNVLDEFEVEPVEFEPFEFDEDLFDEALRDAQAFVDKGLEIAGEFKDAVVGGFTDACGVLMESFMGLREMNVGDVVQALLTPLADMAIKAGEVIVAEGIAVDAAKKALVDFFGGGAVAAGLALIAAGSAAKAGLAAIANGGSASSSTSTYQGGSSSLGNQNITSELTVTVKGELRGRDIVLAGQNTLNSWGR